MFVIPILEIGLAMISIWWAIVLFSLPGLFNSLPELYSGINNFSDPYQWGFLFFFVAIAIITGIAFRNNKLRKVGLFSASIVLALISAGLFLGDYGLTTGSGTYAVLSFMALWGVREVGKRNG
jgi:biotin transporter BioY